VTLASPLPDRLVVDASVAVKWVLPEAGSELARRILEDCAAGRLDLVAPDLFIGEVANVLWKRCRLRRELLDDEARAGLDALLAVAPELVSCESLAAPALELALAFHRPIDDCLYVALALRDGCPLVTADARLAAALGPATGHVVRLEDLAAAS
jgi:predicted nucleic acid-binding protein